MHVMLKIWNYELVEGGICSGWGLVGWDIGFP